MSNRVDEEFTRVMEAVSASARPAPPLIPSGNRQRRTSRPAAVAVSAFVAIMLTLGVGAMVVSLMRSPDAAQESAAKSESSNGSVEVYWEWMTTGAVQVEPFTPPAREDDEPDIVGVTRTGPEPNFDPSELGEVQRIRSYSEFPFTGDASFSDFYPLVESEFIPPVAFIGSPEGTSTQILLYRALHVPSGDVTLCLDEQNNGARGIECSSRLEPVDDGFMWTMTHGVPPNEETTIRVVAAMLPSQTAVVVVTSADGRVFVQRPVGGVSVVEFIADDGSLPISVEALDERGDVIARGNFNGDTPSKGIYDD